MSDGIADPVQPEGQGGEGTGGAPYQEYLDRIPEQVRGEVEPVFKDWDANTTRRFQEHADFRKQWEPYQNLGVHNVDPERMQWALQFLEAHDSNPQAIRDWYQGYAQSNNLIEQPPEPAPEFDQFGLEDPTAALEKLLEQKLAPIMQQQQQYDQWRQQIEQGAREAQLREMFDQQVAELKAKHPDRFDDKTEEALAVIAEAYKDDPQNAISKAWSTLEGILNHTEKRALQASANATGGGGESGGPADANPAPIKTLAEASPIAREAIRAMFQNQ